MLPETTLIQSIEPITNQTDAQNLQWANSAQKWKEDHVHGDSTSYCFRKSELSLNSFVYKLIAVIVEVIRKAYVVKIVSHHCCIEGTVVSQVNNKPKFTHQEIPLDGESQNEESVHHR